MKTAGMLTSLILGAAVSAYAQLGADNKPIAPPRPAADPYVTCGRAFHEKYDKLSGTQRQYNAYQTTVTAEADLDNEGSLDWIVAQSEPNMVPCEMNADWSQHSNSLHIRYDADHAFDYAWQGDLIRGMRVYKEKKQVQVYGTRVDGSGWQQTIPYNIPEGR